MTDPREALRAAGLRCTPARLRVLETIRAISRPVTHAELAAHADLAGMDAITLYRTLSALEESRLVHRVHGLDGTWRTCAHPDTVAGCPGNHAHFLCTTCGRMECLVDQPMPRIDPPPGAAVAGRQLLAWGRCATCAAPSDSPDPG